MESARHGIEGRARARASGRLEGQTNLYPSQKSNFHFPARPSHSLIATLAQLSWLHALPRQSRNKTTASRHVSKLHLSQIFHSAPRRVDLDYNLCTVISPNAHVQGQHQEKPSIRLIHGFLGPTSCVTTHNTKVSYFLPLTAIK